MQRVFPTDAPPPDVIEVSIFGPGKGESIVVHVGDGHWIIVDSCVDQADKKIPALRYLEQIGVDASTQVRLVVATHAHDDHFAGISEIYRICGRSKLVVAPVATDEEFFALIRADQKLSLSVRKSAFAEYRELFAIAESRRNRPENLGGQAIRHSLAGRVLMNWSFASGAASVTSLSPSDDATTRAKRILAQHAVAQDEERHVNSIDPNDMSIVLKVQAGAVSALLGADMTIGSRGLGWQGILDEFWEIGKSSLYKVAHHGSENAYHEEVWKRLLGPGPVALMAPYRAGVKPIPSLEDRSRILSFTGQAYCAASPDRLAKSKSVKRAALDLGSIATDVRDPWGKSGQVRARASHAGSPWRVELFWPAVALR